MSCSERVNKVVEIYVESMKESSADKVREAFHPNAKVVGHLHGDFLEMSTEDFAGFVAAQEPAEVEYEILSTVVEGTTAAVQKSRTFEKYGTLFLIKLLLEGAVQGSDMLPLRMTSDVYILLCSCIARIRQDACLLSTKRPKHATREGKCQNRKTAACANSADRRKSSGATPVVKSASCGQC